MHRHFTFVFIAFFALGLVIAGPATAGDEEDALRQKVQELEKKVAALSGQESTELEQSIEGYLDSSSSWKAADGDGMKNITITAALTANSQSSLDQVSNVSLISGDLDLGFHFQVTENLAIHATVVAASGGGSTSTVGGLGFTLSGLNDGVGTNSNESITGTGRALNVWEAYFVHTVKMGGGDSSFHWEAGALDPRLRFLQNAFANNENTQFMNNLFSDPTSWLWQTNAYAPIGILGLHMWFSFGEDGMHTVNFGYFNPAGQWWNNGWFAIQYTAKLKVSGREMHIRVAVNLDDNNKDAGGDFTIAWGISWDWWATDKIGVFARINGNDDDATRGNGTELDWSLGGEFHIMGNRPNDYFGVAIGQNVANTTVLGPTADDELVFEVYYLFGLEDGKMQVTPYLMYVLDPGGGQTITGNNKDLWILGVRIHVPF